ncbi:T-complex protein 1 subunit gamma [Glycine soja]
MFCYLMGLWDPGYYEDGEFGIRLENVLIVKEADTNFNFGDRGYLSFEHITWAIADIIRTTLGPRFMLKMLFDASGGIMSMIELSCTQDEEVGDGTTSIIILAYDKALEDAIVVFDKIAMPVDANDHKFCC